jgi:hypothetical protein
MTRSSPDRRTVRRPLVAAAVALALAAPGLAAARTATIDLGNPSLMSQRGQRLALAPPCGSSPGERVSVSRFEVVSVKAPDGWTTPDPAGFSVAQPPRLNVVYLRSRETVDAPELTVTVRVAEPPDSLQTFTIGVPPRAGHRRGLGGARDDAGVDARGGRRSRRAPHSCAGARGRALRSPVTRARPTGVNTAPHEPWSDRRIDDRRGFRCSKARCAW